MLILGDFILCCDDRADLLVTFGVKLENYLVLEVEIISWSLESRLECHSFYISL